MKSVVLKACLAALLLSSLTVSAGIIIQEDDPELKEINLPDVGEYTQTTPYGISIEVRWGGATGDMTGYINTLNESGMYVIWEYDAPAAGDFAIRCRYALGSSGNRDGQLFVNDAEIGTLLLAGTGGWDQWAVSNALPVTLNQGINTIRMNGVSSSGLANIDYIEIVPEPATVCLLGLGALLAARRKRA